MLENDFSEFVIGAEVYTVIELLGQGKSGFSYRVINELGVQYVLKKIHHNPVSYYTFGDKFQDELTAYNKLVEMGVLVPKLMNYDSKQELILKEYINGKTIHERLLMHQNISDSLDKVLQIAKVCSGYGINIDYYPSNFIDTKAGLYYIDYEVNDYSDEWNFENWALKYWQHKNRRKCFLLFFRISGSVSRIQFLR